MSDENTLQPETDAEPTPADGAPEAGDPATMAADALDQTQQSVEDLIRQASETPDGADEDTPLEAGTDIDMLGDVDLNVTIELGRTQMLVEDVLKLGRGAVVELDKLAGDPVDVYVNNCLIARGEVLVLNDNFCIRISEIVENLEEQAEEAAAAAANAV